MVAVVRKSGSAILRFQAGAPFSHLLRRASRLSLRGTVRRPITPTQADRLSVFDNSANLLCLISRPSGRLCRRSRGPVRNVAFRADRLPVNVDNWTMNRPLEPKIVALDELANAILVTFEDGESAIYSAALLYGMLPQAQQVTPDERSVPSIGA
jgi:hypothetical protein